MWCVVANVRPEPRGRATSPGTRHFVAGAKIYCVNWMWGTGVDTVVGVGRHRGSSQLVELMMATSTLASFRAKDVYRPAVIRKVQRSLHYVERTQAWCVERAAGLEKWFPTTEDLGERKAVFARALELMERDPRGQQLRELAFAALGRAQANTATADDAATIFVLCDFLEEHGARLSYEDVVTTLRRQRDHR